MNAHNDMTLRDWFAGMAMQGMLSGEYVDFENKWIGKGEVSPIYVRNLNGAAMRAYDIADAMLAEREAHNADTPTT